MSAAAPCQCYVFRHAPLVDVHLHAQLAAEAAEAAAAQGRFWQVYDRLFAHQDRLAATDLFDHAAALGLDVQRFAPDLGTPGTPATSSTTSTPRRPAASPEPPLSSSRDAGTPSLRRRHPGCRAAGGRGGECPPGTTGGGHPEPDAATARIAAGEQAPIITDDAAADVPSDLPETPDRYGAYPRLTDAHLALLERIGFRQRVVPGDFLHREGTSATSSRSPCREPSPSWRTLENLGRADQRVLSVHGERRFLGELDLFSDEPVSVSALAVRAGEVIRVPDNRLQEAFVTGPELKDLVLRAFILRRARLLKLAADLRIIGRPGAEDVHRMRE